MPFGITRTDYPDLRVTNWEDCNYSVECSKPLEIGHSERPVILSAAKNLASIAVQPRFFAALRMTDFRLLPMA